MVTASQRNRCVSTFEGVSAATAEIAAIIALALEANRNLTLRQLKHILVHASESEEKENGYSTNAAGHPFHKVFGFGLLNAERLVLLAKNSSVPLPLLKRSLKESSMRESGLFAQETEFCYSCDVNNDVTCLDTVEDVVIKMRLTNYCKQLRLILVSPSGTESILVDYASELNSFFNKKIQLTSVNFWDEVSFGIWRLKLIYPYDSCSGKSSIHTVSLMIYGTKTWKSVQPQTRRGHDICALPKDNVQTTESVTTTREKSRVSITIYVDLPNFVIVVIGLVILGTIIFVIGRLPSQLHYLRKY